MDEINTVAEGTPEATPTPAEVTSPPVTPEPPQEQAQGNPKQTEAAIRTFAANPGLLETVLAGVAAANPEADPMADVQAEIKELRRENATEKAARLYNLTDAQLKFLAHTPVNEIDTVAKELADALATNTPAVTPAESATPGTSVPAEPVEAPAQAGTPLPVPESISGTSPLKRSLDDIMKQIKAQKAAGMDMDGPCESAR